MNYKRGEKSSQSQDSRNDGVLKSWIERWVWASYCNHARVFKDVVEEKKPCSLDLYHNKHKDEPALIIGAGISLNKLLPILKDWKGAIFAPESMSKTCAYYGHKPDYVMVFDAHDRVYDLFLKDFNVRFKLRAELQ